MIEELTEYYQVEEKFLIVLDSAIPSQIGNFREPFSVENPTINSLTNKSDLIFNLQYPIEKSMEDIQLKCSVKSAVFPNSQYVINSTNSYFATCLIDNTGSPITESNFLMELQQGNYNTESLRQALQNTIQTEHDDNGYSNVIWTVGYNNITNKYTFEFTSNDGTITQFYISFQPKDLGTTTSVSQLGSVIGFLNDFIYISGPVILSLNTNAIFSFTNKYITANYPSNVSGLRAFNVILQNYSTSSIRITPFNSPYGFKNSIINSSFNNSLYTQFLRQNVICNVACNANPMEYIFYEKSSDFYIDLKEPVLNTLHILLTDNYGNLLELNNQDWTITLEMSLLKKKEFKTKSFYEYLSNP